MKRTKPKKNPFGKFSPNTTLKDFVQMAKALGCRASFTFEPIEAKPPTKLSQSRWVHVSESLPPDRRLVYTQIERNGEMYHFRTLQLINGAWQHANGQLATPEPTHWHNNLP